MGRHRRSQPACPFVLNVSNNVPLSTSPQPVQHQQQQLIPSQVEEITGKPLGIQDDWAASVPP